jgi:hypothetical protein
MKIRPLGAELFHMDWGTADVTRVVDAFLQFCESAHKFKLHRLSLYFIQHIFSFSIYTK